MDLSEDGDEDAMFEKIKAENAEVPEFYDPEKVKIQDFSSLLISCFYSRTKRIHYMYSRMESLLILSQMAHCLVLVVFLSFLTNVSST